MAGLGNISASALLSSASSTAKQMTNLQYTQLETQWKLDKNPDTFNQLKGFVQDQYNTLSKSATIADQEKALTYLNRSYSVNSEWSSAQIQQATLQIDNGNYTDAQKIGLVKNLAEQAYQTGDSTLGDQLATKYDSEYNAYQNKLAAAASKATSEAASAASHLTSEVHAAYTNTDTKIKTIQDQLQQSLTTNTNQVDPKLLSGTNGDLTIPAYGAKLAPATWLQMFHAMQQAQLTNYNMAAQDDRLTPEQQATFQNNALSYQEAIAKNDLSNPQIMKSEAAGQPALIRQFKNGIASFAQNTLSVGPGIYELNKNPQQLQKNIQSAVQNGNALPTVRVVRDGVPTDVQLYLSNPGDPNSTVYYQDPVSQTYVHYNVKDATHTVMPGVTDPSQIPAFVKNAAAQEAQIKASGNSDSTIGNFEANPAKAAGSTAGSALGSMALNAALPSFGSGVNTLLHGAGVAQAFAQFLAKPLIAPAAAPAGVNSPAAQLARNTPVPQPKIQPSGRIPSFQDVMSAPLYPNPATPVQRQANVVSSIDRLTGLSALKPPSL